jgi:CRISPR-associated protein (TIGR03986 family)
MTMHTPYNFIRVPRFVWYPDWHDRVSHDVPFEDGYCGTLTLEIKATSPLLIGGAKNEEGEVSALISDDGHFLIPPSSLQGMVRNIMEMAFFAKLGPLVEKKRYGIRDLTRGAQQIYQRRLLESTPGNGHTKVTPRIKAGWLRKEGSKFFFKPCEMARVDYSALVHLGIRDNNLKQRSNIATRYRYLKNKKMDVEFTLSSVFQHTHSNGNLEISYRKIEKINLPNSVATGLCGKLVLTSNPSDYVQNKSKKHMEFVFYSDGPEQCEDESSPLGSSFAQKFQEFIEIHDPQDGRPPNESWPYYRDTGYEGSPFRSGGWMPVFYIEDGNKKIESFGVAYMFKLAHQFDTHDMLKHSCEDHITLSDKLDLPSLIFGCTENDFWKRSLKGRARFDWGVSKEKAKGYIDGTVVLLGPKRGFANAAVRQPDELAKLDEDQPIASYTRSGRQKTENGYKFHDTDETSIARWFPELSGFTVYPATGHGTMEPSAQGPKSVTTKLRAAPAGTNFAVKLRLHNIRKIELQALLWALTYGDTSAINADNGFGEKEYRHRMGMGKPYGLGEIQIAVRDCNLKANANNEESEFFHLKELLRTFGDNVNALLPIEGWKWTGNIQDKPREFCWSDTIQVRGIIAAAKPDQSRKLGYMPLTGQFPQTYVGVKSDGKILQPLASEGWEKERIGIFISSISDASVKNILHSNEGKMTAQKTNHANQLRIGDRVKVADTEGTITETFTEGGQRICKVKIGASQLLSRYNSKFLVKIEDDD